MDARSGAALPAPTRHTFTCSADGSLWPYLVQAPEGEPAAVLVFLHGHYSDEYQGMTPGTYGDFFGRLRRECRARRWAYVTAWYGGNTWMGPLGESGVADLVGSLRARWPGRPIHVCGGSMGGTSALIFAVRRPDIVDSVIALCPAADIGSYYAYAAASTSDVLRNIAAAIRIHYQAGGHDLASELSARSVVRNADRLNAPVFLSHGTADATIPVEATRALAARLRELARPVRYVEIPEGDHDAPAYALAWADALDFVAAVR